LINALARLNGLRVVARTSSFCFRGDAVPAQQIGRALDAHYLLEGALGLWHKRLRVTARLIDASTGHPVWADAFDRLFDDVVVGSGRSERGREVHRKPQRSTRIRTWRRYRVRRIDHFEQRGIAIPFELVKRRIVAHDQRAVWSKGQPVLLPNQLALADGRRRPLREGRTQKELKRPAACRGRRQNRAVGIGSVAIGHGEIDAPEASISNVSPPEAKMSALLKFWAESTITVCACAAPAVTSTRINVKIE